MARKRSKVDAPMAKGPEPAAAVVIYDGRTGAIFGTHFFSTRDGANLPEPPELERIALSHAARDGCDTRRHRVLHVDPVALKPGYHYAVSVKARKPSLVEGKRSRGRSAVALASRDA